MNHQTKNTNSKPLTDLNTVFNFIFPRYGFNLSACQPPSTSCVNTSATPIDCDQGYHFDTSEFTSTVNSEVMNFIIQGVSKKFDII